MGDLWVKDGETLLFIGDSITDCGRRGTEAPLGSGYVRLACELITAGYPERRIRYINKGISGHKVTDLKERWQDDVLYHKPQRLSIKIGINDLHSYLGGAPDGVGPDTFARVYDEILAWTQREVGCPVILLTPFYISTDRTGQTFRSKVMELMPRYVDTVRSMSRKYGTLLVDLHELFQQHLRCRDADAFCPEPVHPHQTGHLIIAQAMLAAMTI